MTRSEPEWWDRIGWATRIVREPPVSARAICAIHPKSRPNLSTVEKLIDARTAEARTLAGVDDSWWFEPSRTPPRVRLAIWDSVIRTVRGGDGNFTDTERAAIIADARLLEQYEDGDGS